MDGALSSSMWGSSVIEVSVVYLNKGGQSVAIVVIFENLPSLQRHQLGPQGLEMASFSDSYQSGFIAS